MKRRTSKAEREARAQIARTHPYVPCGDCHDGWTVAGGGYPYMVRCWCFMAHQETVNALIAQHGSAEA